MKSWSYQQNEILPCCGVSLNDRGFRYGQHLFETLAVREGHPLFFEEHWIRLMRTAARYSFPVDLSWCQRVSDFLNRESWSDGVIRIFLTAGGGAPAEPIERPQIFLFWEKVDFPSEKKLREGIDVVSLDYPVGTTSWGEKRGNYWDHLHALEVAHQAGAEEGLIFDRDGFLIAAAMANVILEFEDGAVVTPPRARGARDGVMLDQIQQRLPKVIEADVRRTDLKKVVAMAVTNSRWGVMPVAMLDRDSLSQKFLKSPSLGLAPIFLKS